MSGFASPASLTDRCFERISDIMYDAIGLSLSDAKKPLVTSRLGPRIQRLGLDGFEDYIARLEDDDDGSEFQVAVDLLTTNETYFFREPQHFEVLERELAARRSRAPLAIWSAASSFGDEAYSTAMLLSDMQHKGQVGPDWSILATDISHRVLVAAKQGVYPVDRLRHVDEDRLRRFCLKGEGPAEGQVMVNRKVRDKVTFGQLNLCKPFEALGPFDVIFLRNVLIYFDAKTKVEVVDRVVNCLNPGGLFFLGTAEGRVSGKVPLTPIVPGAFRKPV